MDDATTKLFPINLIIKNLDQKEDQKYDATQAISFEFSCYHKDSVESP